MASKSLQIPESNCITNNVHFRPRQKITCTSNTSLSIVDAIYGSVTITDEVILSLIRDASFQRLHGIHQHGITPIINVNKADPPVTRFEHSVGAMLLVRSLAPDDIPQQCAALIHDISHTVLSHVADFAFGYVIHEVEKEQYVETTAVPQILANFGYDWRHITSEEPGMWTLLEQPAPLLCADRLDYGLRDMLAFDVISPQAARTIVQQFVAYDGRIMCSDLARARDLAKGYMQCDMLAWANPHHSGLYKFAGEAIRLALAHGVIKKEELWVGTDLEFWNKIVNCGIREIDEKTKYVNERTTFRLVRSDKDGQLVLELKLKIRTIDPEILVRQDVEVKIQHLSELDPEFAKERQDYIDSMSKPIYLAVS